MRSDGSTLNAPRVAPDASPVGAAPAIAAGHTPGELKRRFMVGTAWTLSAQMATHAIRFASNLILARLLAPDVFGLMAMVMIVIHGAEMCSGIGLRGSVVYHRRGDDPDFLNTAWTVQFLRSLLIWTAAVATSPVAARYFGEPALMALLPAVAVANIILGLESTAKFSLIRRLQPGRVLRRDLTSDLLGMSVTVSVAAMTGSVWALVLGTIARATLRCALSWRLIPGYRNRFMLQRQAVGELFRFGRWVLISTLLLFLLTQGDRIVLGRVLTTAELGVYAIAGLIVLTVDHMVKQMASNVLLPAYARLHERGQRELRRNVRRVRLGLLGLFLPIACTLVVGGDYLVRFLYPEAFHEAGWMLQFLALGLIGTIVTNSADSILLACGDSFRQMLLQVTRTVLFAAGIAMGLSWGGVPGMLLGISVAKFAEYPVLVALIRRYGVWMPGLDLGAVAAALAAVAGGLWLLGGL
jgi:O-antigen/teichoic acid export membrane protein